jgi:hypothetical protein
VDTNADERSATGQRQGEGAGLANVYSKEDMIFLSRLFAAASMLEYVTYRHPINIWWTAGQNLIT